MTVQYPETVTVHGHRFETYAEPLASFLKTSEPSINISKYCGLSSSALWRGYIGEWRVSDARLWLDQLRTVEGREIPLAALFPGSAGPVAADWFSGELRLQVPPDVTVPQMMSQDSPHGHELILNFEAGRLIRERLRKHTAKSLESAPFSGAGRWQ